MADKNFEVSTVFSADISDFQKSTQDMQRYIRLVNSEFKAAVGGSKDFEKSAEGLSTKLQQLSRILKAEEQILQNKVANLDKLKKKYGENSKEVQDYAIQVNNQRAKINSVQKSIEKYSKALDDMGDESKEAAEKLQKLEDAQEKVSDGFTVAKGAIAGFIANGLSALAGAAKNAISTVLGLADATREYRQTLATLDTAAEDVGVSTEAIRDKFTDMMGVFNDEDSVTEGLNNLLTAGFDESNLDAITQQLEGAALKWKDTLKFEGLADGLQETLATGSAVGPFAELLERGGQNLDTFNEGLANCTTEAEKQNFVLDELSKLGLAEVSEAYRTQNADMIAAQQANVDYQNTVAEMGERLEPVTTKIREGFTAILNKMLELLEGVDLEAFAVTIEEAFAYFIDVIIPKIIDGLQWIKDNKEPILAAVIAIGAAFLAWKAVSVITGVVNAIKNMSAAFKVLNAVMKANVIGIVVSAIAALVAGFIYLWNNCEGFRKFWKNLWEGIKSTVKSVVDWLGKAFKTAYDSIVNVFGKIGSWFKNLWDGIVSTFKTVGTKIGDAIGGAFKSAINGALATVEKAVNFLPNAINGAIGLINKLPGVNIGKMATISLPRLAKGGVVDSATLAMIGEAGKEAVVPLERNTQGLQKMAHMVADELKTAGNSGVVVNNYNTFNGMSTTRYAMHRANKQGEASWRLLMASQGGV